MFIAQSRRFSHRPVTKSHHISKTVSHLSKNVLRCPAPFFLEFERGIMLASFLGLPALLVLQVWERALLFALAPRPVIQKAGVSLGMRLA